MITLKNNLENYYKSPLTTCHITKDSSTIRIQLPQHDKEMGYKSYENIPTTLTRNGQTCYKKFKRNSSHTKIPTISKKKKILKNLRTQELKNSRTQDPRSKIEDPRFNLMY